LTLNELLRIDNLKTYFYTPKGVVKAVDGVSFKIHEGSTLGLVGESGCGKTTVALSILNLIPYLTQIEKGPILRTAKVVSTANIAQGEIWFKGTDLLKLSQEEVRKFRGKEIAMIFQNPIPALHPLEVIGYQIGEAVEAHQQTEKDKLRELVFEYLGKVQIKDVKERYKHNPHLFSGGEGQRIMIAMALIAGPSLLLADEPVKSLDVIVQRQVLELLRQIKKQFGLSILLITHDFAVVAEISDYVAFMYAGKIVEYGDVVSIYKDPKHPYSRGLLGSIPRIDVKKELHGLPGEPPNPLDNILGCRFHLRCKYGIDRCRREEPQLVEVKAGHLSACFRADELPEWQD
jgi:peptide/nickel transport system ATP-binding protein